MSAARGPAVDFFFDLSSPYSYLASTQMDALAARTGARVAWRPMVLGAVFKSVGATMPIQDASERKRLWLLHDMTAWAAHYGVPFVLNTRFPFNALHAMRLILVDPARAAAVARAAFAAAWAEDRDLTAPAELHALAAAAGLDPERALEAIEEPAIKAALRANTDEAIARGAFGAPTFVVGDQLFWGNDRLHFVERALAG